MRDDKATRDLRKLVERPEVARFWGRYYTITPRLIARVFGDGRKLLCMSPLSTRPNYFVVRVDSSIDQFYADTELPGTGSYLIDDIIDAAEEEYGYYGALP